MVLQLGLARNPLSVLAQVSEKEGEYNFLQLQVRTGAGGQALPGSSTRKRAGDSIRVAVAQGGRFGQETSRLFGV